MSERAVVTVSASIVVAPGASRPGEPVPGEPVPGESVPGDVTRCDLGVLRIEAAPEATVSDLCRAIEMMVGGPGRDWRGLRVGTLRASLDSRLDALTVRSGDSIELVWGDPLGDVRGAHEIRSVHEIRDVPAPAIDDVSPSWWRLGRPSLGAARHPDLLGCGRYRVGRAPLVNDVVLDHPSVSRRHATIDIDEHLVVNDVGSTNGTCVDGAPSSTPTPVSPGSTMRFGDVELTVTSYDGAEAGDGRCAVAPPGRAQGEPFERHEPERGAAVRFGSSVALNRPPKIARHVVEHRTVAPRAPAQLPAPRIPWISGLVPVLMGFVMMGVMWATAGGGAAVWGSGIFFLMSPLLVFGGYAESKRHRRADLIAAQRRFERSFNRVVSGACEALAAERELLEAITPGVAELIARVESRDSRLWEAAGDERLPALRVGTGATPSAVVVAHAHEAAADLPDDLAARFRQLDEEFSTHCDGPVTISLHDHRMVALAGPPSRRASLARSFVVQAMTLLPPSCIEIVVLERGHGEDNEHWSALSWLRPTSPKRWWANAVVVEPEAQRRVIDAIVAEPPPPGAVRLVIADGASTSAGDLERLGAAAQRGDTRVLWSEIGRSMRRRRVRC